MTISLVYLPAHHFGERHEAVIGAGAQEVLAALPALDTLDDPLIRRMIWLREWPNRLLSRGMEVVPFGLHAFTLLEQSAAGLAYGLVGRFWRLDYGLEAIADGAAFRVFDRPGVAKLVMSFEAHPLPDGRTRLVTETRIFCPDRASWLRLLPYWLVIRPVSGLIRRRILGAAKARVER